MNTAKSESLLVTDSLREQGNATASIVSSQGTMQTPLGVRCRRKANAEPFRIGGSVFSDRSFRSLFNPSGRKTGRIREINNIEHMEFGKGTPAGLPIRLDKIERGRQIALSSDVELERWLDRTLNRLLDAIA